MQEDVRASLDDLAIRWETPKGRELKEKVIQDAKANDGQGIANILKDFLYVNEVPHGRDLRCITLDDQDLSDAKFGKVDLSWASLAGADLSRSDLREANLKRANLMRANLALAHLDACDCSRADFSRAVLDGTHFKETKLTGAVFEEAEVARASFESANLAKANFRHAKLEQANFFNADCNNGNFDSGALESLAAKPAKAWGIRYDLERDEFEKQVGLRAITSRSTKRFKGLDVMLQAQAAMAAHEAQTDSGGGGEEEQEEGVFFGTATKKLKAVEAEQAPDPAQEPAAETAEPHAPTRAWGPKGTTQRQAAAPGGPASRPTRPMRPPPEGGRPRRPPPPRPGRPRGGRGTGRRPRPRPRPAPPPRSPIAPVDADAPAPATDWAQAIGQLMGLKGNVTKIVVELGDKSRILYKQE